MSGFQCRLSYDDCYDIEYSKMNKPYSNYAINVDSYVNVSMAKPNMHVASHLVKNIEDCKICSLNKNATIGNLPEYFNQKIEIDSALKGIGRHLSHCTAKYFTSCDVQADEKNRLPGECSNAVAITPLLGDRIITPTNMKQNFNN